MWHPDGAGSHADRDGPPMSKTFNAKDSEAVMLPKASVTVQNQLSTDLRLQTVDARRKKGVQDRHRHRHRYSEDTMRAMASSKVAVPSR